jgi:hypothetical protein
MDDDLPLQTNSFKAELDPLGTTSLLSVEDILENNIHRQDNYYGDLLK